MLIHVQYISQVGIRNEDIGTYQFVENAAVELLLGATAVEKGLVVVLQAVDVSLELLHAVRVDVLDAIVQGQSRTHFPNLHSGLLGRHLHTGSAAGNLATLLQAVELAAAVCLVLALHVIIVECLAAGADGEGSAGEESRRGSNLLDLGNVVGHRRGVHEELLVEPVERGRR